MSEYCALPPFNPDAVMNRERTRVRRWLVRRLGLALSKSNVVLDRDLDAILGPGRGSRGPLALPFRCFEWMDGLAAQVPQMSRAA